MIDKIINDWLNEIQIDLVKNYNRLGLRASGNWEEQLEPFQKKQGTKITIGMLGAPYTGAIETGRSPNKNQSDEALKKWVGWAGSTFLKQWVKDKGINVSPFAIAWKIAREGWKVPNKHNAGGLVSDVLTKAKTTALNKSLALFYVDGIRSDIIKTFK